MIPGRIFSNKKVAIFDFDGTIGDTIPIHRAAFNDSLIDLNIPFNYEEYHGWSTREIFTDLFFKNGIVVSKSNLEGYIQKKQNIANQKYRTELRPIKGAIEFIINLYETGVELFVASSGSKKNVTQGIETLQLSHFFKKIYTSEDVQRGKPFPDLFLLPISDFGLNPEECVVIEDAASGIEAAMAANLQVICIDPTINFVQKEGVIIKSYSTLLKELSNNAY